MIPIRVLLADMPRMMRDIIRDITSSHKDIDVIAELAQRDELIEAAIRTRADVVVVGKVTGSGQDEYRDLLRKRPRLKILAISADGRRGFLHELQPRVIPLGEVSPDSLIEAIRGTSAADGAGAR